MKLFQWLCLFVSTLPHVYGSWGDIDPSFQNCLQRCNRTRCSEPLPTAAQVDAVTYEPPSLSVPLSCSDLCLFGCIEESHAKRVKTGQQETKYYGHWRFARYFGLEEPASVICSVFNALPHFLYLVRSFQSHYDYCYMKLWLQLYSAVACVAWLSSCVYHARKTEHSAHFDLISALGFIVFGFFMAVRRIRGASAKPVPIALLFSALLVGWGVRAWSMLEGKVSFQSHMTVSIAFVVVTTLMWVGWVLHTLLFVAIRTERQAKYLCLLCQIWLVFASALEIFDFPPVFGVFDAHALWHLATVPLGFLWYRFWALDRVIRVSPADRLDPELSEVNKKLS
jgi:hypothetical protein